MSSYIPGVASSYKMTIYQKSSYRTSRLPSVQFTKRPGYRTSSLQNVQVCQDCRVRVSLGQVGTYLTQPNLSGVVSPLSPSHLPLHEHWTVSRYALPNLSQLIIPSIPVLIHLHMIMKRPQEHERQEKPEFQVEKKLDVLWLYSSGACLHRGLELHLNLSTLQSPVLISFAFVSIQHFQYRCYYQLTVVSQFQLFIVSPIVVWTFRTGEHSAFATYCFDFANFGIEKYRYSSPEGKIHFKFSAWL